jgi:hypothetical protein
VPAPRTVEGKNDFSNLQNTCPDVAGVVAKNFMQNSIAITNYLLEQDQYTQLAKTCQVCRNVDKKHPAASLKLVSGARQGVLKRSAGVVVKVGKKLAGVAAVIVSHGCNEAIVLELARVDSRTLLLVVVGLLHFLLLRFQRSVGGLPLYLLLLDFSSAELFGGGHCAGVAVAVEGGFHGFAGHSSFLLQL